jgi:CheY-like chemotaxis protein
LVVNDEEDIREVMRALLKAAGYTVTVAEGGPMALKLAQDFPGSIDLLITYIRMPEMDGTELSLQMQALRPETKVLFMSAFAGDLFDSGRIRPGQSFLAKPFSGETLVEKLREVL